MAGSYPPINGTPIIKAHVVGKYCNLEKDSELYLKIIDSLMWVMINNLSEDPTLIQHLERDTTAPKIVGEYLTDILKTNVTVHHVSITKGFNPGSYHDEFYLVFHVQIAQKYIDSYCDLEAQDFIDNLLYPS
jgi:hypothetical protein